MEYIFLSLLFIPFVWICFLGLSFFARIKLSEDILTGGVKWISIIMSLMGATLIGWILLHQVQALSFDYPAWIKIGHYEFKSRFYIDLLGSCYALLTSILIGIIFRFSKNYLHKEVGYFRFIFLLSTLMFGLMVISFARSLDIIFVGWELVGTTSVLLIGYFYSQVQPVRHSIKAIISYRFCDMGLLAAGAWAHHYMHTTDFKELSHFMENPHLKLGHGGALALTFIGFFVIWASLAKSGQLPFSSWLPAAMEGPTPSSAIFYGALSIHLGPFLLLRFYDYFVHFPVLLWIIGLVGASSAIYASGVGRTRSDAKTMLAYATISQVGIIWIEIALGFTNFALFHVIVHASLRTWQFLRSSSLIQDFVDNPVVQQHEIIHRNISFEKYFPGTFRKKVFIHALHGFHLDFLTNRTLDILSWPFRAYFELEKKWLEVNNVFVKFIFRKR